MTEHTLKIAVLIIQVLILSGCTANNNNYIEDLMSQADEAWKVCDFNKADSLGQILISKAQTIGNTNAEAMGYYYRSAYNKNLPDTTVSRIKKELHKAIEMAEIKKDPAIICRLYNQMGVWSLLHDKSFYTSQYYFARSMSAAKEAGDRKLGIPAEMNLSEVFRITDDTLGFEHDQRLFEYSQTTNSAEMKCISALHCALYILRTAKDTSELSPYINVIEETGLYPDMVNLLYARFFLRTGRYMEAERYIKLTDTAQFIDYQIPYGEIEQKLGNYGHSNQILSNALEALNSNYPESARHKIYIHMLMSENYYQLGDYQRAWEHRLEEERQRKMADSLANIDRLSRYKIEYDVLKRDYELQNERLRISRLTISIVLLSILLISGVTGFSTYIRRRNRLFREIVSKQLETIKLLELQTQKEDNTMTEENNSKHGPSNIIQATMPISDDKGKRSGISEVKSDEIYSSLLELTNKEQIWRDKTLTRDSLAERIGCNRTYLSEVIREKTGLNYSQYLNTCRINEAMRILSDPDNDIELKCLSAELGFLSINTFYTSFRKQTGLTPAQYRRTARELVKDKRNQK